MASDQDVVCNMIPEIANYLMENGATLIVLNTPPGTDFGIDLKSWTTGVNFKGIKMIPPGLHFIHYSAADEYGELAPRIGFFHQFHQKQVLVKYWDQKEENISEKDVELEEMERYKCNLKNLDKFLGPYPYDILNKWKEMVMKIDDGLLERCRPLCGFVRSALELENCDDFCRSKINEQNPRRRCGLSVEEREELLLPNLKAKPGTELRLTEIPNKKFPENATPSEITQHSMDTTFVLNSLLEKLNEPCELIGEMQLAFVCFLLGQSLDSFEHWKKLISLICGADKAINEQSELYLEFLNTLEKQLYHVPQDILCDIVASNNLIYHNLRKLFSTVELLSNDNNDNKKLKSAAIKMRIRLTCKFSWDFSNLQIEDADEAPVVVKIGS